VRSRAIESIIKVEVAKCGVEIVAPQQADHASPKPDALRLAGRTRQEPCGFGELVDLLFIIFRALARLGGGRFLLLGRLVFPAGNGPRPHSHNDRGTERGCNNTHAK